MRPLLLTFPSPSLEKAFRAERDASARVHDLQAAAVYLAMVAAGSLLYLVLLLLDPKGLGAAVDDCGTLIAASWAGPATHLALLAALPAPAYAAARTPITLALRAFYLVATAVRGYGHCGVGRVGARLGGGQPLESLFSAVAWRSGLVGLTWFPGAFPLIFWEHVLVQSAFAGAYWATLAPAVCEALPGGVAHGDAALAALAAAPRALWAARRRCSRAAPRA